MLLSRAAVRVGWFLSLELGQVKKRQREVREVAVAWTSKEDLARKTLCRIVQMGHEGFSRQ